MLKKILVVALALMMVFALAACGGDSGGSSSSSSSSSEAKPEETAEAEAEPAAAGDRIVRYGRNMANVFTLDVWDTSLNSTFQISDCIFDRLLDKNPETLELELNLLEEFPTVSEDGLTYTFKLKQGVKFHDGKELTAEDVKYTFEYFYDADTMSNNTWVCDVIKGAKDMMEGKTHELSGFTVIDDYNFTIEIEYPYAAFTSVLAVSMLPILPKDQPTEAGDDWGIGTINGSGPYKLKEFLPGEKVVLETNPDYHGDIPDVDGIEFINMDSATAFMEWEAGTIDLCDVDSDHVAEYEEKYPNNFVRQPVVGTVRFQVNPGIAPLDNKQVREAITYAINREEIVNGHYKGNMQIINGVIPDGIPGFDPNREYHEYDPEKAKALLAEAGFPDGITITASVRDTSEDWKQVLQLLQNQMAPAGITLEIETLDAAGLMDKRNNGLIQCMLSDWYADYIDADMYMYNLFQSDYSKNMSNIRNDAWYDEQVENARRITDQAEREEIYKMLDNYLVNEDYNFTPLFQDVSFMLCSDRVSGVFMKKDLLITFSHASIK
ncbi:MAG: ABC transporter substrate-binding protein [Clostridia bacterium]|nr:ABC transporter substrate-binding protein [Clostridia bacterium]